MTTETSCARPFGAPSLAADAFRAFFDMVDAPAALCSIDLDLLLANAPFEVLCGTSDIVGHRVSDFVGGAELVAPDEGCTLDFDVTLKTGQLVALTMSRRGQTVGVVARSLSPMLDSLAAAGRALIEQARVESQLLEIGRAVAGAISEEELVATVARGVRGLFPQRTFCVRIIDPRTSALTSLYAEGRLRDGVRDTFYLRHSMVEKTHLDPRGLAPDRVKVINGDLPLLFEGSVRGLSAPLAASGQFFGTLTTEYPPGLTADLVSDERVLIQLANQVAVAVRNVKLIDELSFMRKYLEELLENANALILVAGRDGRVVVFNGALVRLTGRGKGEVLGLEVAQLVPACERLKLAQAFASTLEGQNVSGLETAFLTHDGKERRVFLATSAALSQSGEVEGVIAIGQDLTRMRELERRVVQAEKLASLGELAASVVHEINNPMTAVAAYADALLKRSMTLPTADGSDVEKYRRIVENADRVLRFTRDLVSYARPAHDKPEEVDIRVVVERAAGLCEHVLLKHGLAFERRFGDVPRFLAVKQNLVQVFVNLITNACHATDQGGRISIQTENHGGDVVIEVSDTGAGIPADIQGRVFEPFFTTKPDGKGTGLGLSIAHGIIERHGGDISLRSQPGMGTTFIIRLPMFKSVW